MVLHGIGYYVILWVSLCLGICCVFWYWRITWVNTNIASLLCAVVHVGNIDRVLFFLRPVNHDNYIRAKAVLKGVPFGGRGVCVIIWHVLPGWEVYELWWESIVSIMSFATLMWLKWLGNHFSHIRVTKIIMCEKKERRRRKKADYLSCIAFVCCPVKRCRCWNSSS